jgi:hypothetical protein
MNNKQNDKLPQRLTPQQVAADRRKSALIFGAS